MRSLLLVLSSFALLACSDSSPAGPTPSGRGGASGAGTGGAGTGAGRGGAGAGRGGAGVVGGTGGSATGAGNGGAGGNEAAGAGQSGGTGGKAAGAGQGGGGKGNPLVFKDVADFWAVRASTYCSAIEACCTKFGRPGKSLCLSLESEDVPVGVVDPDSANACLAHLAGAACEEGAGALVAPACMLAVKGQIAPGAACKRSEDCADGGRCALGGAGAICRPRGMDGATCAGSCEPTLFGEMCQERAQEPSSSAICMKQDGLACTSGSTCAPFAAVGDSCKERICGVGLWCSASVCVTAGNVGESCDKNRVDSCVAAAYCSDGTCLAKPKLGQPCESGSQARCAGLLTCSGSVCVEAFPKLLCD